MFKEAMASCDAPLWREAINNEIESIMHNHNWELVYFQKGAKFVGYKWIFKKELKPDG